MWNKDSLQELIRDRLSGHQFFVVANREPYLHQFTVQEDSSYAGVVDLACRAEEHGPQGGVSA